MLRRVKGSKLTFSFFLHVSGLLEMNPSPKSGIKAAQIRNGDNKISAVLVPAVSGENCSTPEELQNFQNLQKFSPQISANVWLSGRGNR